ncbi:MAG: hypothetical protein AAAB16_04200 [Pseudomonas sp.]|uniref:hypothetical protein n=1 Tax=Pseudomonas sp. TaxID=306 RepID=UPI0030F17E2C
MDESCSKPRYILRNRYLGSTKEIAITEGEYEKLKKARETLSAALAIEELFSVLITNFNDAQNSIDSTSKAYFNLEDYSYYGMHELMQLVNVRTINFITAAKLYTDNLTSDAKYIGGKSLCVKIEKKRSELYDASPEYRAIDQLRNYALHAGAVIHSITGNFVRPENGEVPKAIFYTSKAILSKKSDRIKTKVMNEMPDKINISEYISTAVEKYKELHTYIQTESSNSVANVRKLFEDTIQTSTETLDETTGLAACIYRDEKEMEFIQIFLEWDDVRMRLAENAKLESLAPK